MDTTNLIPADNDQRLLWQIYASEVDYLRARKELEKIQKDGPTSENLGYMQALVEKIKHDDELIAGWLKLLPGVDITDPKNMEFRAEALDSFHFTSFMPENAAELIQPDEDGKISLADIDLRPAVLETQRVQIEERIVAEKEKIDQLDASLFLTPEIKDVLYAAVDAKVLSESDTKAATFDEYQSLVNELKAMRNPLWVL